MKLIKSQYEHQAQLRGSNFYGTIKITEKALNLQLTEFQKKVFFTFEITNINFQKRFKRFPMFRKINDLFDEISQSQKLQITNQGFLLLPLFTFYDDVKLQLKVKLKLLQKNFNSQAQKANELFQIIEKMNQKLQVYQRLNITPQIIKFQRDESNQNYKMFEVSQNGKIIKKIDKDQTTCFNHFYTLKRKGVYYFKVRVIKTANRFINIGVCAKDIIQKIDQDLYSSVYLVCLNLYCGDVYKSGKIQAKSVGLKVVEGQNIIKVEIDLNKNKISWLQNQLNLYTTSMPKELEDLNICPMISLFSNGDSVQFLDE